MLNHAAIDLPLEAIREYCKHHPVKRLSLFGSTLRADFSDESDVDLLVEYLPSARVTLLDMAQIEGVLASEENADDSE